MKTITLILGVCIFLSLTSFSQDLKKLAESDVDKSKVKIAQDFATNYMAKLNKGETYQFKDEAIDILKNSLTAEKQKAISQQIKGQFGDFKSLDYAETWIQNNNKSIVIIRFKGVFEKSNKKLQIQVVFDASNKIAGFFIKPWSDMLN